MRSSGRPHLILGLAGIAWALAAGAGFFSLETYRAIPGEDGDAPHRLPVDSRVQRDPVRATLVMLAHPRCPCTRASLAELERIITHCQGLVTAHVLFLKPGQSPKDWEKTDLWRTAAAIPNVRVLADEEGAEAIRFGVKTSGHVVLYDASGRLLFSGGITGSRGHQGDNPGCNTVISLLTRGRADRARAAVFGCPLFDRGPRCDERAGECSNRP
jgi:hypothetical protein